MFRYKISGQYNANEVKLRDRLLCDLYDIFNLFSSLQFKKTNQNYKKISLIKKDIIFLKEISVILLKFYHFLDEFFQIIEKRFYKFKLSIIVILQVHVRVPLRVANKRKQVIIDLSVVNDAAYSMPCVREILTET